MQHGSFSEFVATTLAAHAAPLAQHWLERALAATPRPSPGGPAGSPAEPALDAAHAERVVRALAASVRTAAAASLVLAGEHEAARRVLAGALGRAPGRADDERSGTEPATDGVERTTAQDARPAANVMRLGWAAGGAAYAAGQSVHHVVRDADLLLAVVLADVERSADDAPPGVGGSAAEGVGVARRLQRAAAGYMQAAVSGFVHALLRGLRERYRLLRHDLRNPLGTIRSALSLMEDETVPVETRQGPHIRAMVARNAGSLDRLISRRLDDAAAVALLAPPHEVRVRDVALAARREVREAARLTGCDVVVDVPEDAPSRVDGAALELTLSALLLAALANAAPGGRVRVACVPRGAAAEVAAESGVNPEDRPPGTGAACVVLRVDVEPPAGVAGADAPPTGALPPADGAVCWDEGGVDLALALAQDHGGRLGLDADVEPTLAGAALVAALARSQAVYLRLPLVDVGPTPGSAPVPPG